MQTLMLEYFCSELGLHETPVGRMVYPSVQFDWPWANMQCFHKFIFGVEYTYGDGFSMLFMSIMWDSVIFLFSFIC